MVKASNVFDGLSDDDRLLFDLIQKNGPIDKNQMSLMTGMKLSTLNRAMQSLGESCLVKEKGTGQSTGGRRPVLFDVDTEAFYIVGVDISRTYTRITVSDLKMNALGTCEHTMNDTSTPEDILSRIADTINSMLYDLHIDPSRVIGAGIGTVGPLDRDKGVILNPVHFAAEGWRNVPVKETLEKLLGLPVYIDNGANTAVLAEALYGEGRDYENIAYFHCGVGIRTGVISSGRIIRTVNDAEDAFGHMVVDLKGEKCSCGNYGCIECYSTIASIQSAFVSEIKIGRTTELKKSPEEITYSDVLAAAGTGDTLALEVVNNAAAVFGTGLSNFISLLNPGLVVLSGPLFNHSTVFYQACIDTATKKHMHRTEKRVSFSRGGQFKDNAIALGAAALVVEHMLRAV